MKKYTVFALAVGLFSLASLALAATDTATTTFGANVDEIAVLDIAGTVGDLVIVAPAQGGERPATVTNSDAYAQYTSVLGGAGTSRTVTAQITGGTNAPAGTNVFLSAATPAAGTGTVGATTISSTLDDAIAVPVLSAIGSCYTGTAATDGSQLTFGLQIDDMASVIATSGNNVEVTLTLTEDL